MDFHISKKTTRFRYSELAGALAEAGAAIHDTHGLPRRAKAFLALRNNTVAALTGRVFFQSL
jgi:hypothetical protein